MKNFVLLIIGTLFGRKLFFKLGILLQHIAHRMMGIGNYENEIISGELFVAKTLKRILKKKSIIFFDVGAGDNSENYLLLKMLFPNIRAYLFEPMPKTFSKLTIKYKETKNVSIYNLALSNKSGTLDLWDYKGKQTQHATAHKEKLLETSPNIEKTTVKKNKIDSFLKANNINKIDFLKIDTEGQEYNILLGAQKSLRNISFIQFEFNSMNIYSNVRLLDFYNLLSDNFDIYRMYQDGLLKIDRVNPIYDEIYEFQNYLAINKKLCVHI